MLPVVQIGTTIEEFHLVKDTETIELARLEALYRSTRTDLSYRHSTKAKDGPDTFDAADSSATSFRRHNGETDTDTHIKRRLMAGKPIVGRPKALIPVFPEPTANTIPQKPLNVPAALPK